MLMSMTGFGRAEDKINGVAVAIELRAVNSRFLEFAMRLPRGYEELEDAAKSHLQSILKRGRVTVTMNLGTEQAQPGVPVLDEKLLLHYAEIVRQGARLLEGEQEVFPLSELLKFPDVISYRNLESGTDTFTAQALELVQQAGRQLLEMRRREGALLEKVLQQQLEQLEQILSTIRQEDAGRLEVMAEKMRRKLTDMGIKNDIPVDESRIEQEIVLWSDKLDIQEELTRLSAHIQHFKELMQSNGDSGKRLNFLLQEMNREANTIGSKANSMEIGHAVVELKNEIERIREQVQNIQ